MNKIIKRAIEVNPEEFATLESDLYCKLNTIENKPDFVTAFLDISSWLGTSLRGGVWTYYEATAQREVEQVISFLQKYAPDNKITELYSMGNHDYSNEKYQSDFNYPQEWLDESDIIDTWIDENELVIVAFMQELLSNNKSYFD